MAIPNGKYQSKRDGSIVMVTDTYIYLYIDGYSAGEFTILEEDGEACTFVCTIDGNDRIQGKWYYDDEGVLYLKIGGRVMVYCD